MARPSGEVLISMELGTATLDILRAQSMWCVLYKNQPIGVRRTYHSENLNTMTKYMKTCYTTPAPAHALSLKLNEIFNCTDFTVCELQ